MLTPFTEEQLLERLYARFSAQELDYAASQIAKKYKASTMTTNFMDFLHALERQATYLYGIAFDGNDAGVWPQ